MNERERFVAAMICGTPDRPPYGDYMCYESTRNRWEMEGLPQVADLFGYFGFDQIDIWDKNSIPYNWNFGNLYDTVKISEDLDYETWRDHDGSVVKYRKDYKPPFMPMHESYPVYDRKSWKDYREKIIEKNRYSD